MKIISAIKQYIGSIVRRFINAITPKDNTLLTFIPHGGCEIDGYNFINYKSDSALSLFHYIIEKHGDKFKYQVAAGYSEQLKLQELVSQTYPNIDVKIILHPAYTKNIWNTCKELSKSKYIFTSEAIPFDYINKSQNVFYLGYYASNFKNDFNAHYLKFNKWYKRAYTNFFSSSFGFSQINALVYNVPLSKFIITGLVRNDNLLLPYQCPQLDDWIKSNVEYEVKKVFLYTPTHRDYERTELTKRSLLGFDFHSKTIENFLSDNNAVIIIKIHSHQNADVLKRDIPKGILLHHASTDYGLNELLQRADCLITDYTSTYFDYLLLDRPVLFNFYDFDIYQKTRGFAYDPLDAILAGEKFSDQDSMLTKMSQVMKEDKYKEKREFVRDLLFKYKDPKAAERVYNFVFDDQKTPDK